MTLKAEVFHDDDVLLQICLSHSLVRSSISSTTLPHLPSFKSSNWSKQTLALLASVDQLEPYQQQNPWSTPTLFHTKTPYSSVCTRTLQHHLVASYSPLEAAQSMPPILLRSHRMTLPIPQQHPLLPSQPPRPLRLPFTSVHPTVTSSHTSLANTLDDHL
jgi:hypothetical protein